MTHETFQKNFLHIHDVPDGLCCVSCQMVYMAYEIAPVREAVQLQVLFLYSIYKIYQMSALYTHIAFQMIYVLNECSCRDSLCFLYISDISDGCTVYTHNISDGACVGSRAATGALSTFYI